MPRGTATHCPHGHDRATHMVVRHDAAGRATQSECRACCAARRRRWWACINAERAAQWPARRELTDYRREFGGPLPPTDGVEVTT